MHHAITKALERLPVREGGIGFTNLADIAPHAYAASRDSAAVQAAARGLMLVQGYEGALALAEGPGTGHQLPVGTKETRYHSCSRPI